MGLSRSKASALAVLLAVGALAGCGGGDDDSEPGVDEKIAQCIDATDAKAATAESAVEGAVGAVDVVNPSTVVHVFETEQAAAAHAEQNDELDKKIQIRTVVVYTDDPAVVELVKPCVPAS